MSPAERRLYRALNAVVRLLLRSRLHGLLSGKVMLLTVSGRRSGRSYVVPVSYLRDGGIIRCFTGADWSGWWKNLRGGAVVTARVRGRDLRGYARAATGGDEVCDRLGRFLRESPGSAGRYGILLDADGRPDAESLKAAVGSGRVVMVSVRPESAGLT